MSLGIHGGFLKLIFMARLEHGLLGMFRGKLGGVVVYQLMGKTVVRTVGKVQLPPTEKQLAIRQGMSLVNGLLKPIQAFIKEGFRVEAAKVAKHPQNLAVSYNMKNALKGYYPNREIDYPKVRLTQGELMGPEHPAVELTATGLNFTWDNLLPLKKIEEYDQVMIMVYFPALGRAFFITEGVLRVTGMQSVTLSASMQTAYMETYMAFVASDRSAISNSVYTGSFNKNNF